VWGSGSLLPPADAPYSRGLIVELLITIFLLQIVTMIFLTVVFRKLNAIILRLEREPPAKAAEKKTEDIQGPQMNVVVGAKVD
jgi:hypothetical protein